MGDTLLPPQLRVEGQRVPGEVEQPGQYAYVPGITVQNAIAIAGGYTPRANQSVADITRKVGGKVMTGRVTISDPVIASDTIYVLDRHNL